MKNLSDVEIIALLEKCVKIKKYKTNISRFKNRINEYNNDLIKSPLTLKERALIIDNISQFELKLAKEKLKFKKISLQ